MKQENYKETYIYQPSVKNSDAIPLWWCFPSTKKIGMSSLGYLSLFKLFDINPDVSPERIFTDSEKTSASHREVKLMGFSVSFELDFLGIFKILEKHKIPLRSAERGEEYPVIFGGGPVMSANPEPYADFFDVIILGDGEDILNEIITAYKNLGNNLTKKEKLINLAQISGVYIPSLYEPEYNSDYSIKELVKKADNIPDIIYKRSAVLKNCMSTPILTPDSMFGDMFLIETARGCPKKCRFCLASYLNLPARYPDYECIIDAIETGLNYSNKIGFLGALITEHPHFEKICEYILEKRKNREFEISVSSLRADRLSPLIVKTLVECGQKQSTIALEAGSQRMRNFINKKLSESDIKESIKTASENGLSALKLYAMIGLPTEEQSDIEEMIRLLADLKSENKSMKLILSSCSFVPKAGTPFQWDKREETEILQEKVEYLKSESLKINIQLKPTSLKWDYVQAVLSRGDRRLSPLLELVYKYNGSLGSWRRAYKEITEDQKLDIPDFNWYALRERTYAEILPWDFIHTGVDRKLLISDRDSSYNKYLCHNA